MTTPTTIHNGIGIFRIREANTLFPFIINEVLGFVIN